MTDWKARCAELEGLLSKLHELVHADGRFLLDEDSGAGIYGVELDISIDESLTRTRAELAQPELKGTTRREALIHFESFAATFQTSGGDSDLILRALAEAALAQPEPQELTKQEAQELFNSIRVPIIERLTPGGDGVIVGYEPVQPVDFARAVLVRCCGCSAKQ